MPLYTIVGILHKRHEIYYIVNNLITALTVVGFYYDHL